MCILVGEIIRGFMKKSLLWVAILGTLSLFTGCYQVHSDDDLRSVPVTNNPNILPASNDGGGMSRFIPT